MLIGCVGSSIFLYLLFFSVTILMPLRLKVREWARARERRKSIWVGWLFRFFLSGIMYVVQHSTLNAVCIILFWRHWGEGELWDARFLIELSRTVQCYVLLIRCHGDNTDKNKIKMKPPFWILKKCVDHDNAKMRQYTKKNRKFSNTTKTALHHTQRKKIIETK